MAIFRCNKCKHIREVASSYIGKSIKCPKCDNKTRIYDTTAYINALIVKHNKMAQELRILHREHEPEGAAQDTSNSLSLEGIDIHNTNIFSQPNSYKPIIQWFDNKNIQATIDPNSVDTTGFFDEIAMALGNNYNVLCIVSNQIKYVQNKGYDNVKIDISKKKKEEIQQITTFCKMLYDYSFVAKYFYQKKDKIIRLTLQMAPTIKAFFNGIWMEWFTLITLLNHFRDNNALSSCARNVCISFSGGDSKELDIFFLTNKGTPVCIECKSGEFRHDIHKYLSLRKRLDLEKQQFIICIFGLSSKQTQGMTSMYDLAFTNEKNLVDHINTII
ncbi:MAG TPA: hypothetical protein ENJ12_13570 [Thiolapillus brandeum]|uniref:DUF1887 family protein n=1 Tax=Thiolapillus brandeum TaxID=1076588 RepID=A0A831WCR0_9GAMM|nr:hypothetical protein [Thiolapillus brandeum]